MFLNDNGIKYHSPDEKDFIVLAKTGSNPEKTRVFGAIATEVEISEMQRQGIGQNPQAEYDRAANVAIQQGQRQEQALASGQGQKNGMDSFAQPKQAPTYGMPQMDGISGPRNAFGDIAPAAITRGSQLGESAVPSQTAPRGQQLDNEASRMEKALKQCGEANISANCRFDGNHSGDVNLQVGGKGQSSGQHR